MAGTLNLAYTPPRAVSWSLEGVHICESLTKCFICIFQHGRHQSRYLFRNRLFPFLVNKKLKLNTLQTSPWHFWLTCVNKGDLWKEPLASVVRTYVRSSLCPENFITDIFSDNMISTVIQIGIMVLCVEAFQSIPLWVTFTQSHGHREWRKILKKSNTDIFSHTMTPTFIRFGTHAFCGQTF